MIRLHELSPWEAFFYGSYTPTMESGRFDRNLPESIQQKLDSTDPILNHLVPNRRSQPVD